MQKLANRREAAPLLGSHFLFLALGHKLGHTPHMTPLIFIWKRSERNRLSRTIAGTSPNTDCNVISKRVVHQFPLVAWTDLCEVFRANIRRLLWLNNGRLLHLKLRYYRKIGIGEFVAVKPVIANCQ